ncbi:hypothetical protein [uncultured Hymenobacter sp.]|uniref:hypothetical protein n=1 Tax=uncultured Hymenobacter sp. TaxID=170016 RepID=UPI0035C9EC02
MASVSFPNYNLIAGQAGTGEAFLLGPGLGPLNLIRQQDALNRKNQQAEMAAKQQRENRERQDLQKLRMGLTTKGFLPFTAELQATAKRTYDEMKAISLNPSMDRGTQELEIEKRTADYKSKAEWTTLVENRFKDITQLSAKDKRYNPAAVDTALYKSLDDEQGNRLPIAGFNPDKLNTVLENPDTFNRNEVASSFLDSLAEADRSTKTSAARPGRLGQSNTAESNFFEVENGAFKLDPATANRIPRTDRPEVIEAAKRDPFVSRIINQQMQAHAGKVNAVVEKMRNLEPLTPEEQDLVEREQTGQKQYANYLNELLLPHAYQRSSEIQTYSRPLPVKAAPQLKAAPKRPANEVMAIPTVGFQASTYVPEATGRFGQMKKAMGITPSVTTNHYPTVGVSFGSASRPYAEAVIDNREAEVVGENGKTTRAALGNGKVPMQVVGRDYVLYVNGKRVGRKEAFRNDSEAYNYLLSSIERLTPEQARKAELRAEYRGTVLDKTKTANDGAGGQPKPTGTSTTTGAATYDTGISESRLSVIAPANQATDAQLQQASGGKWNPRQPTKQQTRAIEALTRKGGRVVSPYGTQQGQPTTPSKTVGSKDVLGFGNPSRGGNIYKAAGTKPTGVDGVTSPADNRRGGLY